MSTETITSRQNEKLKLLRRLADPRGRRKEGLFATEGEDLLRAGLGAGHEPVFVLVPAPGGPTALAAAGAGIPVQPELLDELSGLGSGAQVIAAWPLPEGAEPGPGPCLYLHGVADPGNVGTIARTATALAGAELVLGPGCADPYGPKAVRASMGAIFSRPPRAAAVEATPEPRLALVAHGGAELDVAIARSAPVTLCLGAEREGLDRATLAACGERATIPVRDGVESLNVAAAAAIALHRICSAAGGVAGEAPRDGGEHA